MLRSSLGGAVTSASHEPDCDQSATMAAGKAITEGADSTEKRRYCFGEKLDGLTWDCRSDPVAGPSSFSPMKYLCSSVSSASSVIVRTANIVCTANIVAAVRLIGDAHMRAHERHRDVRSP